MKMNFSDVYKNIQRVMQMTLETLKGKTEEKEDHYINLANFQRLWRILKKEGKVKQ